MRVWSGAIGGLLLGAFTGGGLAWFAGTQLHVEPALVDPFILVGGMIGLIVGGGIAAREKEEPWRKVLQYEDDPAPDPPPGKDDS